MTWDTIQQLIRIIAYSGGSIVFGEAIASGDAYQAAIGGLINVVAFAWWAIRERGKKAA